MCCAIGNDKNVEEENWKLFVIFDEKFGDKESSIQFRAFVYKTCPRR